MDKRRVNIPHNRSDRDINGFIVEVETEDIIIRFIVEDEVAYFNPKEEDNELDQAIGIAGMADALYKIFRKAVLSLYEQEIEYAWNNHEGSIYVGNIKFVHRYSMGEWERK